MKPLLVVGSIVALLAPSPGADGDTALFDTCALDKVEELAALLPGFDPAWLMPGGQPLDVTSSASTTWKPPGASKPGPVPFAYTDQRQVPVKMVFFTVPHTRIQLFQSEFFSAPDLYCTYVAATLLGTYYHELLHVCTGASTNASTEACRNAPHSCWHLALDYATHSELCSGIATVLEDDCTKDEDPMTGKVTWDCPQEAIEAVTGMCDAAKLIENKWNVDGGARVNCECQTVGSPCPPNWAGMCPTGGSNGEYYPPNACTECDESCTHDPENPMIPSCEDCPPQFS